MRIELLDQIIHSLGQHVTHLFVPDVSDEEMLRKRRNQFGLDPLSFGITNVKRQVCEIFDVPQKDTSIPYLFELFIGSDGENAGPLSQQILDDYRTEKSYCRVYEDGHTFTKRQLDILALEVRMMAIMVKKFCIFS